MFVVYPCCGRPAQRGPSQRPLPQSGCAWQSHTPVTPPEASIHHVNSDSVLSDSALKHKAQTAQLVHTLLRHQSLIVRLPGDISEQQTEASSMDEEQQDAKRISSELEVRESLHSLRPRANPHVHVNHLLGQNNRSASRQQLLYTSDKM